VCDLDTEECLLRLREKGQTVRWQPISPPLTHALVRLAEVRAPGSRARTCCVTATVGR